MSATLRLTRESFTFELRRGEFVISVDGRDAGKIAYGETAEIPVEAGQHTLRIRAGRYSSHDHSFDAADGDVVSFRCHGAMVWPTWLLSFFLTDLGISLHRE